MASAALQLALERERCQAALDAAIKYLDGVTGEQAATQAYLQARLRLELHI